MIYYFIPYVLFILIILTLVIQKQNKFSISLKSILFLSISCLLWYMVIFPPNIVFDLIDSFDFIGSVKLIIAFIYMISFILMLFLLLGIYKIYLYFIKEG